MPPTNWNPKGLGYKIIIERGTADEIIFEHKVCKGVIPFAAFDFNNRVTNIIGTENATWTGTENYEDGKFAGTRAADFDGSSRVEHPTLLNVMPTSGEFSISFLMYLPNGWDNTETTRDEIMEKVNNTAVDEMQIELDDGTGSLSWDTEEGNNGVKTLDTVKTSWASATWFHIVLTWGAAGKKIYIDGTLDNTDASATTIMGDGTGKDLVFSSAVDPLVGRLQHCNFYDIELTQAQVTDLQTSPSPWGGVSKTASATKDFKAESCGLEVGTKSNHGSIQFTFDDSTKTYIDTTVEDRKSAIKRGWMVELWCGKKPADLYRALKGTIETATVIFPSSTVIKQRIFAIGESEVMATRFTHIKRYQDKQKDTITVISVANPTQVTSTSHGLATGETVEIDNPPKHLIEGKYIKAVGGAASEEESK